MRNLKQLNELSEKAIKEARMDKTVLDVVHFIISDEEAGKSARKLFKRIGLVDKLNLISSVVKESGVEVVIKGGAPFADISGKLWPLAARDVGSYIESLGLKRGLKNESLIKAMLLSEETMLDLMVNDCLQKHARPLDKEA